MLLKNCGDIFERIDYKMKKIKEEIMDLCECDEDKALVAIEIWIKKERASKEE